MKWLIFGDVVFECRDSSAVEQLFRKQQVVGSNPILGSLYKRAEQAVGSLSGRQAGNPFSAL